MSATRSRSTSLRGLRFTRLFIAPGRRVAPWIPEAPVRAYVSAVFRRWPGLWGLERRGKRLVRSRRAFELAFPDRDGGDFAARWTRARGEAMATSLFFLARWLVGRPSSYIRPAAGLRLPVEGPFVVAALHYSIDPAVQLSCVSAGGRSDIRWAVYPLQSTVEDDREVWLTGSSVPGPVEQMFLPVTERRWIVEAASHLRRGGGVFVAIDAPFDAGRPAANGLAVGGATIPLAPSVELFAQVRGVRLLFAAPRRVRRSRWEVELRPVADLTELVAAAEAWIAANEADWAGWPHVLWRDDAEVMRRKVAARSGGGRDGG